MNNKELVLFYYHILEKLSILEGILSVIGIYDNDEQINIDGAVDLACRQINIIREDIEAERDNLIEARLCDEDE